MDFITQQLADFSVPSLILFSLLIVVTLIQLYQLIFVQLRLARYPIKTKEIGDKNPISVIIYARNHAAYLEKNIPEWLSQEDVIFELVLVNDCSWDDTEDLLRSLAVTYPQVKIVNVPIDDRFRRTKKYALTLGIKAAQYEQILFIEADYLPRSKKWIAHMQANFTQHTELVLGYAPFPVGASFSTLLSRFDHFMTALYSLSFAIKGKAFSGYGQNIAFTKTTFFAGKGYASHMHLTYGETDFFINQHATRKNTRVEINPASHVLTDKKQSYAQFVKDKFTRMDTLKLFTLGNRLRLHVGVYTAVLFYLISVGLLILGFSWPVVLGIYLFRLFLQYAVYFKIAKRLKHPNIQWAMPILEPIYLLQSMVLRAVYLIQNKS
ncbi:MAG: glycosyltransferase [Sphingobacteriales bacterium]|nr:glycosyltransferase [Sphingobacteriales bacterium]